MRNGTQAPDSIFMDLYCFLFLVSCCIYCLFTLTFDIFILTGRRIAELELYIALSHIMKNFSVEFPEKAPMDYILKVLLIPERQLNLTVHDLIKECHIS